MVPGEVVNVGATLTVVTVVCISEHSELDGPPQPRARSIPNTVPSSPTYRPVFAVVSYEPLPSRSNWIRVHPTQVGVMSTVPPSTTVYGPFMSSAGTVCTLQTWLTGALSPSVTVTVTVPFPTAVPRSVTSPVAALIVAAMPVAETDQRNVSCPGSVARACTSNDCPTVMRTLAPLLVMRGGALATLTVRLSIREVLPVQARTVGRKVAGPSGGVNVAVRPANSNRPSPSMSHSNRWQP